VQEVIQHPAPCPSSDNSPRRGDVLRSALTVARSSALEDLLERVFGHRDGNDRAATGVGSTIRVRMVAEHAGQRVREDDLEDESA